MHINGKKGANGNITDILNGSPVRSPLCFCNCLIVDSNCSGFNKHTYMHAHSQTYHVHFNRSYFYDLLFIHFYTTYKHLWPSKWYYNFVLHPFTHIYSQHLMEYVFFAKVNPLQQFSLLRIPNKIVQCLVIEMAYSNFFICPPQRWFFIYFFWSGITPLN